MTHSIKWRVHRRKFSERWMHQTGPWGKWWIGCDFAWIGLAVIREHWGWRIIVLT